jgi:hypothetical protein
VGRVTRGTMDCVVICIQLGRNMLRPITVMVLHKSTQHLKQAAVKTLRLSVSLWMMRGRQLEFDL